MKRFIAVFLVSLFAFMMVGLAASVLKSDSGDAPDGVDRVGFPFVFKEQSGPVALDYFSRGKLAADIALAAGLSACAGFCVVRKPTFSKMKMS
jgi:hypothetical protein